MFTVIIAAASIYTAQPHWICTQSGAGVRPTCTQVDANGRKIKGTAVVTKQK